jgi:hypothetical protein
MSDSERIVLGNVELKQSTERREYSCRFVKAGRVRGSGGLESNIEIPAQVLRDHASDFTGRASFLDHAGWFDTPSLKALVGVTEASSFNEETQSVDGKIRLYETPASLAVESILDSMLEDRRAGKSVPDVGLSIVFWPVWAPRDNEKDPRRVVDIKHVESVDFVFEPAADGRVIEALSCLLVAGEGKERPSVNTAEKLLSKTEVQMATETVTPAGTSPNQPEKQERAWEAAMANAAAHTMIASSGLPAISRERLMQQTFSSPEGVNDAILSERTYLAKLAEANVVQIGAFAPRGSHIQAGRDGYEELQLAVEALIAGKRPPSGVRPLSGIREMYTLLSGDYEMNGMFHSDRVQFAAVTSATMAGMVANALNKAVVNAFQQYPQWWSKIATIMDFNTLQQVKWITLGGVGELPTVAEGAAYTEMTWDDQTEVANFVKKGGYLGITLEAIDKDDTGRLQAAPRAIAQAAWLSLSKSVAAIFTINGNMADGVALFHNTHANLGSTALSHAAWLATAILMRKFAELNSGERLGALTYPKYCLVPPDLEYTAIVALGSELLPGGPNNDINAFAQGNLHDELLRNARERVIVVDIWTDATDWVAVADPNLYPSIGIGFRYGREPEIFSVASPTAGLMFSNDTLPVKARYFYATGATDFRGMYKHVS